MLEPMLPTPEEWAEKTDLVEYAQRQAQSCVYLCELLERIKQKTKKLDIPIANLLEHLIEVHMKQEKELRAAVDVPEVKNRKSYYFDEMYKSRGLNPQNLPAEIDRTTLLNILSIHAVSYSRGNDRYIVLSGFKSKDNERFVPVWSNLKWDAFSNVNRVLGFMQANYSESDGLNAIRQSIKTDEKIMKKIFEHKNVTYKT